MLTPWGRAVVAVFWCAVVGLSLWLLEGPRFGAGARMLVASTLNPGAPPVDVPGLAPLELLDDRVDHELLQRGRSIGVGYFWRFDAAARDVNRGIHARNNVRLGRPYFKDDVDARLRSAQSPPPKETSPP